jgi:hypothetical protein
MVEENHEVEVYQTKIQFIFVGLVRVVYQSTMHEVYETIKSLYNNIFIFSELQVLYREDTYPRQEYSNTDNSTILKHGEL